MLKRLRRLPSPAFVISVIALVVAVGGGSFALAISDNHRDKKIAKKMANKQIEKRAPKLSVNHANSATTADTATTANHAGTADHATTADNATTANDATTLDGKDPSAFEPSSNWIRTGIVTATAGQQQQIATFGPFTLTLMCVDEGSGAVQTRILGFSTEDHSDIAGHDVGAAGDNASVVSPPASSGSTDPVEQGPVAADFFAPSGKDYVGLVTGSENMLGATSTCQANALISPS